VCSNEGKVLVKLNRRGVSTRGRTYRKHGEVVKLAAEIAGCSIWNVYAVLSRRHHSVAVINAIEEARRRLETEERVA
jgi:hypothetical protein